VKTKGLLVDYGGVLTSSAAECFRAFERRAGLPKGTLFELIADAYQEPDGTSPIVRFERGESTTEEFGAAMAEALAEMGHDVDVEGMAERMFADSRRMPGMWDVVRRARAAGVRTGLVSNSWGLDGYPIEELEEVFDALVISGEIGLRKPDPEIYLYAAERIGVPPESCAFVDDLERNVSAARAVGMFGVHHTETESTAERLSTFLGVDLR
jgi:putative hydrolase of the HAD superfamily